MMEEALERLYEYIDKLSAIEGRAINLQWDILAHKNNIRSSLMELKYQYKMSKEEFIEKYGHDKYIMAEIDKVY